MKKIIFFLTAISLFTFHGCQKDPGTIDNRIAITDEVITSGGNADISGTISCPIENINVELLVDDAEDMSAPTKYNVNIGSDNTFTVQITDLNSATTYYYKFRAYTNVDDIEFEVKSFTTDSIWVDLGLPSGLKWATCNVGASKPEDYGNYYAWGETSTKSEYTYDNSICRQQMPDISGNATYDAARANWGGTWRMPTKAEMEELRDNCTWTWTAQSGINGYKVTGPNGNSIFLPAAGDYENESRHSIGTCVYYWGSTPAKDNSMSAFRIEDESGSHSNCNVDTGHRFHGHSVRPVSD